MDAEAARPVARDDVASSRQDEDGRIAAGDFRAQTDEKITGVEMGRPVRQQHAVGRGGATGLERLRAVAGFRQEIDFGTGFAQQAPARFPIAAVVIDDQDATGRGVHFDGPCMASRP